MHTSRANETEHAVALVFSACTALGVPFLGHASIACASDAPPVGPTGPTRERDYARERDRRGEDVARVSALVRSVAAGVVSDDVIAAAARALILPAHRPEDRQVLQPRGLARV